ncbi:hypothetical protein [Methylophilus methylotrophus]|jgi:hypothetical protein|uniref:hypothetical protein n=1 Tax=Methylophilus methylotrophus TaxID=17 RepID=UPI000F5AC8D2|nr:hypothetical protein [Methylophilus methylotrophus]
MKMSIQDENLKEFKRLIQEAAKNAKTKDDLGLRLISSVAADYEEHLDRKQLYKKPASILFHLFKRIILSPFTAYKAFNLGPKNKDPFICNYIEDLYKNKVINQAQVRIINSYQMLHASSDKVIKLAAPSSNDRRIAVLQSICVLVLLPFVVKLVWDVSVNLRAIPFGYLAGAALGLILRDGYYRYWGRNRIISFMAQHQPWIKQT